MASPLPRGMTAGRVLLGLDALLVALSWPAALWLLGGAEPVPALLHPVGHLLALYALGLYRREALVETRRALARVGAATLLGAATAWALTAPLGLGAVPPWSLLALLGSAVAARGLFYLLRRRGAFRRRLLVVGAGRRAWEMLHVLGREARTLAFDVVFLHDPAMGEADPRLLASGRVRPACGGYLAAARDHDADQVLVAPDERRGLPMRDLLACRTAGYPVSEAARFLERETGRIDLKRLDLSWLLYTDGFAIGALDRALKRVLDVAASGLLLLLTAPFLLAAMLAVKLGDGGPVLYRQSRVTRGGRVFQVMKLRTMRVDAERFGAVWAAERDPRITPAGRVLRRSRLDELPQLLNVLRGDMSFVGPRPERPEFTRELAEKLPLYEERHLVRAGLTGWAQVNYPYGASLDDARSKLSYDLFYVKNYGLLLDLLIILQTVRVVLWPGGGAR